MAVMLKAVVWLATAPAKASKVAIDEHFIVMFRRGQVKRQEIKVLLFNPIGGARV